MTEEYFAAPIQFWDCPSSCKGHDPDITLKHIWPQEDLREALDNFLTSGRIDKEMYNNDPTYHAIVYKIKDYERQLY